MTRQLLTCTENILLVLHRMGCGALDYRQQAQQIELRTGGMSVSTQVIPDSTQLDMFEQVSRACFSEVLQEADCSFMYVLSP